MAPNISLKQAYRILSLAEDATEYEAAAAYQKCAIISHPDRHVGNPDAIYAFRQVARAYQRIHKHLCDGEDEDDGYDYGYDDGENNVTEDDAFAWYLFQHMVGRLPPRVPGGSHASAPSSSSSYPTSKSQASYEEEIAARNRRLEAAREQQRIADAEAAAELRAKAEAKKARKAWTIAERQRKEEERAALEAAQEAEVQRRAKLGVHAGASAAPLAAEEEESASASESESESEGEEAPSEAPRLSSKARRAAERAAAREQFPYPRQLRQILAMGYDERLAKDALLFSDGELEAALEEVAAGISRSMAAACEAASEHYRPPPLPPAPAPKPLPPKKPVENLVAIVAPKASVIPSFFSSPDPEPEPVSVAPAPADPAAGDDLPSRTMKDGTVVGAAKRTRYIPCIHFNTPQGCPYGDYCQYMHKRRGGVAGYVRATAGGSGAPTTSGANNLVHWPLPGEYKLPARAPVPTVRAAPVVMAAPVVIAASTVAAPATGGGSGFGAIGAGRVPTKKAPLLCKLVASGQVCLNGDNCLFLHSPPPLATPAQAPAPVALTGKKVVATVAQAKPVALAARKEAVQCTVISASGRQCENECSPLSDSMCKMHCDQHEEKQAAIARREQKQQQKQVAKLQQVVAKPVKEVPVPAPVAVKAKPVPVAARKEAVQCTFVTAAGNLCENECAPHSDTMCKMHDDQTKQREAAAARKEKRSGNSASPLLAGSLACATSPIDSRMAALQCELEVVESFRQQQHQQLAAVPAAASVESAQPKKQKKCQYFSSAKGCTHGDNCKFRHVSNNDV